MHIPTPPLAATRCDCSVCRRLGALWAFYPLDAVEVQAADGATREYVWGERTRRFVRCASCGCTTHVLPVDARSDASIDVNLRLFEPGALGSFRVRRFDGADTWQYLDEQPAARAFARRSRRVRTRPRR